MTASYGESMPLTLKLHSCRQVYLFFLPSWPSNLVFPHTSDPALRPFKSSRPFFRKRTSTLKYSLSPGKFETAQMIRFDGILYL